MKIYKISFIFCFISALCLFSCGLANYSSQGEVSFQDSRIAADEDAESAGVFNSPAGRLESGDPCIGSDDCIELCDSMSNRLSIQERCYNEKEKAAQTLRDVYNNLAIGNPRKLERLGEEEMESFLVFGPELWRDAIIGFERGRKEDCEVNEGNEDARDREDCKFENYYKQQGYWSSGAAATLEWIAKNDWLAELMLEHDEDHLIMTTLLDILAHGGKAHGGEGGEPEEHRANVCTLDSSLDPGSATPSFSLKRAEDYQAFGSNCLDSKKTKNFFVLAVEDRNPYSVNLGHQTLVDLCGGSGIDCIKHFYCNIGSDDNDNQVLLYVRVDADINGLDRTLYSTLCN